MPEGFRIVNPIENPIDTDNRIHRYCKPNENTAQVRRGNHFMIGCSVSWVKLTRQQPYSPMLTEARKCSYVESEPCYVTKRKKVSTMSGGGKTGQKKSEGRKGREAKG